MQAEAGNRLFWTGTAGGAVGKLLGAVSVEDGKQNTQIGSGTRLGSTTWNATVVGFEAAARAKAINDSVFVGSGAGGRSTFQSLRNTFVGKGAGADAWGDSSDCVAVGAGAAAGNAGLNNVTVGADAAAADNIEHSGSVTAGASAARACQGLRDSVAIGMKAAEVARGMERAVAIGAGAGWRTTQMVDSVAIGSGCLSDVGVQAQQAVAIGANTSSNLGDTAVLRGTYLGTGIQITRPAEAGMAIISAGGARVLEGDAQGLLVHGNLSVRGGLEVLGAVSTIESQLMQSNAVHVLNRGIGPALHVNQEGANLVALFEDSGVAALTIFDGGNISIGPMPGSTLPQSQLVVNGALETRTLSVTGRAVVGSLSAGPVSFSDTVQCAGLAVGAITSNATCAIAGAITGNGNCTIAGGITANSTCTIAGRLGAGSVYTGAITGNSTCNIAGRLDAGSVYSAGTVTANSCAITGRLDAGSVYSAGTVTANSCAIAGRLDAGSVYSAGTVAANSCAIAGRLDAGSVYSAGPRWRSCCAGSWTSAAPAR